MSEQALIFEVGESGFDRYVIENSHKVPVLVEFMGVWSEPRPARSTWPGIRRALLCS